MANLQVKAKGKYENIQPAIDFGLLPPYSWIYITDRKSYAFIDKNKQIHELAPAQILFVEELPSENDGDTNVLYICNNILYFFDGSHYRQVGDNVTVEGNVATVGEVEDALDGKSYDGSDLLTLDGGMVIAERIMTDANELVNTRLTEFAAQLEELVNAEVANAISKMTASDISYGDGSVADALDALQVATDEEMAEMLEEEYSKYEDETGGEP